ncbi:transposase [Streptomyces kaempferi]
MPQLYALGPVGSSSVTPSCDCLAHRFGKAADNGTRERRYPTDMTDAEWAVVRPLLPVPGWLQGGGGQPEAYCHRAMLDAVRYLVDNGSKWRAMPSDFPPWDRVYASFRRWRDHGLVTEFHDRLRGRVRVILIDIDAPPRSPHAGPDPPPWQEAPSTAVTASSSPRSTCGACARSGSCARCWRSTRAGERHGGVGERLN